MRRGLRNGGTRRGIPWRALPLPTVSLHFAGESAIGPRHLTRLHWEARRLPAHRVMEAEALETSVAQTQLKCLKYTLEELEGPAVRTLEGQRAPPRRASRRAEQLGTAAKAAPEGTSAEGDGC